MIQPGGRRERGGRGGEREGEGEMGWTDQIDEESVIGRKSNIDTPPPPLVG